MDGGKSQKINQCEWDVEFIPDEDYVYRQVSPSEREKDEEGRRFPNEGHFSLKDDEDALSANWDKYADVRTCYKLISVHCGRNGKYLQYQGFRIFKFPVSFLKHLEQIDEVTHSPVICGNPAPICKPNNRAHTSIVIDDNDPEVRVKLSDYCRLNHSEAYCDFNLDDLEEEIQLLREKKDSSFFHLCKWPKIK